MKIFQEIFGQEKVHFIKCDVTNHDEITGKYFFGGYTNYTIILLTEWK